MSTKPNAITIGDIQHVNTAINMVESILKTLKRIPRADSEFKAAPTKKNKKPIKKVRAFFLISPAVFRAIQ
jgi:hypothetical protein